MWTPRVAAPEVIAEGTFFVIKLKSADPEVNTRASVVGALKGITDRLVPQKRSFKLYKDGSKDVGNAYYIECSVENGAVVEGFPIALSSDDSVKNVNEARYEFELSSVAAGLHRLRFEKKGEFHAWREAIDTAIAASKKRNQRGSLLQRMSSGIASATNKLIWGEL